MKKISRLQNFVQLFTQLIDKVGDDNEEQIFEEGRPLLLDLIRHDDWLLEKFSQCSPERYQQYLLYCDPMERFSVVSFVWGPGQTTPVHDHTVWGMIGVMRGIELCEDFELDIEGKVRPLGRHQLIAGEVDFVSPCIGDIHKVSNALEEEVSISIHIYGANIGTIKRNVYDINDESKKVFISGYSNIVMPSDMRR